MKNLHFTTVLERVVSRRDLPNLPCGKEKKKFYRGAAFSKSSGLSSSSQQIFSAAFLSSSSQQLFSAAFLSSLSQQLFSAALLSRFSQQPFSAALLSSSSQQLFSAALLSSSSQQPFSAALLSYHLAVVRGWWSASNIILLWSRVGGQVCYRSLEGPFRNAFRKKTSSPRQKMLRLAGKSTMQQRLPRKTDALTETRF